MPLDSCCSAIAAAQRNGYTATNWSGGDARWNLSAAGANARTYRPGTLYGAYLTGAHAVKAKLTVLSKSALPLAFSLSRTLAGAADMDALVRFGMPVSALENITLHVDNGNNSEVNGVVMLTRTPGGRAPQSRYQAIQPIRAYSATTLTQYAWTGCALTIDGTLDPNTTYDVLGMAAWSAGAVAARLVSPTPNLDGDTRPTVVAGPTSLTASLMMFPEVLRFTGSTPPSAEFCSASADTAEEITLILGVVGKQQSQEFQQSYQQQ